MLTKYVLPLLAGPELSVPASKTYLASVFALALISGALTPESAFNRALNGLCLGAQIDASNAALAAHSVARASARRWWIEAQPLGTWRGVQ